MKTDDSPIAHIDPVLLADLAPYRLLREIGRGGMSVVYEALDTRTAQRAALKVLALPFSVTAAQRTDLIARFRREERVVTQLSHPNIVAIQEIGERTGVHFIAMEFLPGESLRARLERGPLPLREAGAVLAQVAAALDAVHGAGIVHRDIKPSNIMLLPDGSAKLLDFGVARHSDDTVITSGGLVVGSPAYLSPEQVRGGAGTAASDVWSLGVLLYEMLAGHPPFLATDVAAVMYQVIHEAPPPLTGLPPGMAKVVKRALEKVPERRFPSAPALAEAFAATLPAERSVTLPLQAARPAASLRRARWAWGLVPLLAVLAAVWGLSGRRAPAPALTSAPSLVPAPSPVPAPEAAAVPVPAASPVRPKPLPSAAVRVTLPVRRPILAQSPPAAPAHPGPSARSAASAQSSAPPVRRPHAVPRSRPRSPGLLAEKPAATPPKPTLRPPVHFPKPLRPLPRVAETPLDAPPIPPPASRPAQVRPAPSRPNPSKADDDAAAAARLQKFIWSEGR